MTNDKTYTSEYNPDVLSCIANLSNDEVFTPPEVVNSMLDMLPQELFSDPDITFLDPAAKSGVFLREIAKRLLNGLKDSIPDLQERIDHIFHKQLFGIAITEMTSLLSRRSLYCSKYPNSKYSVSAFNDIQGNIRFKNTKHYWKNEKCVFCGASEKEYGADKRGDDLETHAYEFIHTIKPEEIFKMKFDVIIGNPPYQMSDGGNGASAKPIYQLFVEQAKKLNPRYLTMIIPARWFTGGKGLDNFRKNMLYDKRLSIIHDYFDSSECFPGIDLSGGVCYFLWNRDYNGECNVTNHIEGKEIKLNRSLITQNIFIRFNQAVPIIEKILKKKEFSFESIVSSRKPFGISTTIKPNQNKSVENIKIYAYPKNGYISKNSVIVNHESLNKYKLYIAKAYGERGKFPYLVIGKPFIGEPNTCCSETYLMIGPFDSKLICENIKSYMQTKFFRFCVLQKKNTQNAAKGVYQLVPMQDFSKPWTDKELYEKYDLTNEEIEFIESMIRPMDLEGDNNDE